MPSTSVCALPGDIVFNVSAITVIGGEAVQTNIKLIKWINFVFIFKFIALGLKKDEPFGFGNESP
jgi:hypothetical protein